MAINDTILDDVVLHSIRVDRAVSSINNSSSRALAEQRRQLIALLQNSSGVPQSTLMELVQSITQNGFASLSVLLRDSYTSFSDIELDYQQRMLGRVLGRVGLDANRPEGLDVEDIIIGRVAGQSTGGQRVSTLLRQAERKQIQLLSQAIRSSENPVEDARRLLTTRSGYIAPTRTTRNTINTINRTVFTHIQNTAAVSSYKANSSTIREIQYISTLDSRTSGICQRLDGRTWGVNETGIVRPPAHFNCRSTTIPVVRRFQDLPLTDEQRDSVPARTRASFDGEVPAETRYSDWLVRQSQSVQDEVLGPERASLLRSGRYELAEFYKRDGTFITLEQLRSTN